MKDYYVYMLTNWTDEVIYIAVTNNLERRVREHRSKQVPGFTKKYNLTKLVYYEVTTDMRAAIEREKQLKNWSRKKKNFLVETLNSEWIDLSDEWYKDISAPLEMTAKGTK